MFKEGEYGVKILEYLVFGKRFLNIPCSQHWVDKLSRIAAFISQRLLADFINATCSAVDHRRAAT